MDEENKKINEEKKEIKEDKNIEETTKPEGKGEKKKEGKKEERKKKKIEVKKKEKAEVKGRNLSISTKHAIAICKFIKFKPVGRALEELEEVIKKKRAVPMKGELPHRKGMERGRYPVNASKVFIKLLKGLTANSSVAGIEEPYITIAKADKASRPYKRFGSRKMKRTHVYLEARERKNKEKAKEEEKEFKKTRKEKNEEVREVKSSKLLEVKEKTDGRLNTIKKGIAQKFTPLPIKK